jgi:23S rRNA (uridine2552-2'-O)-methyltransferase
MARNKSDKAWMREHVTDHFVQQAKRDGLRSRAAYKLDQLCDRDKLIVPGMTVVDLGSAPGGWSQIAVQRVGAKGRVIAVDVLEMTPIHGVTFIRGDFREPETLAAVERELDGSTVDLVVSDMSPNISGIGVSDQARAAHLAELALEFAVRWLKPGGNLLVKAFQGSGYGELRAALKIHFRELLTRKPEASRGRSSEIFLLGKGLRKPLAVAGGE